LTLHTPVVILEEMLTHSEEYMKSAAKENLTQRLLATHSTSISQLSSSEFAMFFELALDDSISPYQAYDVAKLLTNVLVKITSNYSLWLT
jgi:hypothetical protein